VTSKAAKGGKVMKYLWRRLMGRCTSCGQKLKSNQTTTERISEINDRADHQAKSLGRCPQVQSCKKCHKLVFEGEAGFVQSLLLVDMVDIYPRTLQPFTARPAPSEARCRLACGLLTGRGCGDVEKELPNLNQKLTIHSSTHFPIHASRDTNFYPLSRYCQRITKKAQARKVYFQA
jgi:hypothetical protein